MNYEKKLEIFYTQVIKKGDTIIDVGAHSGRHTKIFSQLAGINSKIIAFEPNPDIRKILNTNIQSWTNKKSIKVLPFATSNENKKTTFVIANDRPEESGLLEREYNGPTTTTTIEVEVIKIDIIIDTIDSLKFIKIDTEGAEYHTLLGLEKTLKQYTPIIAFEFGQASYKPYGVDPKNLFQYLSRLNYNIFSINGIELDESNFIQASIEQIYWDYIACHHNDIETVKNIFKHKHKDIKTKHADEINKLYNDILKRESDPEGLNFFTDKLIDNTLTLEAIANILRTSDEYLQMDFTPKNHHQ